MKPKIVTVWNVKGGVGKTTCTFNIAAELARRGKKVLCVDLDHQCNLSSFWEEDARKTSKKKDYVELLMGITYGKEDPSKNTYRSDKTGLDLIHGSARIPKNAGLHDLRDICQRAGSYDYVLIDTHPSKGNIEKVALATADLVLIPIYLDKFSRDNLNLAVEILAEVEQAAGREIKVGVFANRLKNQQVQRAVFADLIEKHDYPIMENCISDRAAVSAAARLAKPVFAHRSKSPVSADFSDLTDEVVSMLKKEGK